MLERPPVAVRLERNPLLQLPDEERTQVHSLDAAPPAMGDEEALLSGHAGIDVVDLAVRGQVGERGTRAGALDGRLHLVEDGEGEGTRLRADRARLPPVTQPDHLQDVREP